MLYARESEGSIVQESVENIAGQYAEGLAESLGYVPVLAVRAEGVEEVRQRIADTQSGKAHATRFKAIQLRWALRVLGLEERP